MVAAVALSVCVGVTLGVFASSPATSLFAPAAVRPAVAARPMAATAPVSYVRAAAQNEYYAPEQAQYSAEEAVEQVQYVQSAPASPFNWLAAALFAASAATGAAFLMMKKRVVSGYEAIRDEPTAIITGAGKAAGIAATSAVLATSANAASLTYDEKMSLSYNEMRGSGLSNTCPIIADGTGNKLSLKAGSYTIDQMCLEPSSFMVKSPSADGKTVTDFEKTKLMTRLTYTLDGIRADLNVGGDGSWALKEKDGIDYAATTVQLAGGERVPFLFTIKNLDAKGDAGQFIGQFDVPSYRGATFLDPKGRGAATGYDTAVALPAGSAGDEEELAKENAKVAAGSVGTIAFKVAKVNAETGEVAGVFESIQPSDTDLGAKAPKDIKTSGVWYAQIAQA